jgi:hypothetical protein
MPYAKRSVTLISYSEKETLNGRKWFVLHRNWRRLFYYIYLFIIYYLQSEQRCALFNNQGDIKTQITNLQNELATARAEHKKYLELYEEEKRWIE